MISPAIRSQSKSRGEFNLQLISKLQSERNARKRREIRNRVLELNLGLVRRVSSKFSNSPQDENEFFSEGCLALMDAVELFDPERGFQFSTYATTCIRNRLFRLFRQRNMGPIEVPLNEMSLEYSTSPHLTEGHRLDECRKMADAVLSEMPERERELVRLRFGLDETRRARSFREVADEVGLSKERVRQLVTQVILTLQSRLVPDAGLRTPSES